jgi:hypothetical protein
MIPPLGIQLDWRRSWVQFPVRPFFSPRCDIYLCKNGGPAFVFGVAHFEFAIGSVLTLTISWLPWYHLASPIGCHKFSMA